MMNRSGARLTRTALALAVVGLGVTACTEATTTPPTLSSPTLSSPATSTKPAPAPSALSAQSASSPAAPGPKAQSALNNQSAPEKVTVPRSVTAPETASAPTKVGGTTTSSSRLSSPACSKEQSWGTRPVFGSLAMSESPLYLTRVGRHDCFDRVVFDINGPQALSFVARYVPVVAADGSGKPVPVTGRAALEVIVRAPIYGTDNLGQQPGRKPPTVGESLVTPAAISGWPSLRAVRFAGSFEGQTTVAVGVRDRLPFRAFVTRDGSYQRVVLDIAH